MDMTPWAAAQWVIDGRDRWHVLHAHCTEVLRLLPEKSVHHIITDPPYSRHQHESVRRSGRNRGLADGNGRMTNAAISRTTDLGFEHLSPRVRRACAREFYRLAQRWVAVFSDVESCWMWRLSLETSGLQYVRTCEWRRIGGAPQFTGDRPAQSFETITLAHPKGRKKWNGGGKAGCYEFPIVANRIRHRDDRLHTTQKPIELMMALIEDFTDPDDVVLDPFCGSGTTGVACLRLGRRFIGVEMDAEYANTASTRLDAEVRGSTIQASRAGQGALFR